MFYDQRLQATDRDVVRSIWAAVLVLICDIGERRMKQHIPQIGDKQVAELALHLGRRRQRRNKLDNLLHLQHPSDDRPRK
jgi:hypothetical protein